MQGLPRGGRSGSPLNSRSVRRVAQQKSVERVRRRGVEIDKPKAGLLTSVSRHDRLGVINGLRAQGTDTSLRLAELAEAALQDGED